MKAVEEWRDIKGWEGLYRVSSLGEIYSIRRDKRLSPAQDKYGYLIAVLNANGVSKTIRIHREVGLAFIPNPDCHPQLNHIDENKRNNCVGNLEWCTNQYNSEYSRAVKYKFISPTGKVVTGNGLNRFCRENGLSNTGMSRVNNGKQSHHKKWRKHEGEVWTEQDMEEAEKEADELFTSIKWVGPDE
jgi:hypothetical protein